MHCTPRELRTLRLLALVFVALGAGLLMVGVDRARWDDGPIPIFYGISASCFFGLAMWVGHTTRRLRDRPTSTNSDVPPWTEVIEGRIRHRYRNEDIHATRRLSTVLFVLGGGFSLSPLLIPGPDRWEVIPDVIFVSAGFGLVFVGLGVILRLKLRDITPARPRAKRRVPERGVAPSDQKS